jgi:hypothetical protein
MPTPISTQIMPTAMLNTNPPSSHRIAAANTDRTRVRDFESIITTFQILSSFNTGQVFCLNLLNDSALCRGNVKGKQKMPGITVVQEEAMPG